MISFPLYNILSEDLPKKDLTLQEKKLLVSSIQKFDNDTKELIFVVIKCHYLQNAYKKGPYTVPYSGVLASDGVGFNLLDLPTDLRQMIYKFVCLHMKKLDEEKDRSTLSEAE